MRLPTIAPTKAFTTAGVLTLAGIATGLVYVASPGPYTMVAFLGPGHGCFFAGMVLFALGALSVYRQNLESITHRTLAAGAVVCEQGQDAEHVFVIGSGEVEFVHRDDEGRELVLGRLGPDTHFGEVAVLNGRPYNATGRAVTDVELVAVNRTGFERLYERLPHMRKRIDAELHRKRALVAERHPGLEMK